MFRFVEDWNLCVQFNYTHFITLYIWLLIIIFLSSFLWCQLVFYLIISATQQQNEKSWKFISILQQMENYKLNSYVLLWNVSTFVCQSFVQLYREHFYTLTFKRLLLLNCCGNWKKAHRHSNAIQSTPFGIECFIWINVPAQNCFKNGIMLLLFFLEYCKCQWKITIYLYLLSHWKYVICDNNKKEANLWFD